jgi:hypothetical protein
MGFVFMNPNPKQNLVGDCVIRAISVVTNRSWDDVFIDLMVQSFIMKDIPSSNPVWGAYLHNLGYQRKVIPNTCPDCYTVRDFTNDYPKGKYILGTGTHVIAVMDGNHYDTWNSEGEIPVYYWKLEV